MDAGQSLKCVQKQFYLDWSFLLIILCLRSRLDSKNTGIMLVPTLIFIDILKIVRALVYHKSTVPHTIVF